MNVVTKISTTMKLDDYSNLTGQEFTTSFYQLAKLYKNEIKDGVMKELSNYPEELQKKIQDCQKEAEGLKKVVQFVSEDVKNNKVKLQKNSYGDLNTVSLKASVRRALAQYGDSIGNWEKNYLLEDCAIRLQYNVSNVYLSKLANLRSDASENMTAWSYKKDYSLEAEFEKIDDYIAVKLIDLVTKSQHEHRNTHDDIRIKLLAILDFQKKYEVISWDLYNGKKLTDEEIIAIHSKLPEFISKFHAVYTDIEELRNSLEIE
ncbi:hypothetical protein LP083-2_188 [Listeria phage LP-083-2]|uniref:Uncharacterized protein n=3 Tax=Pecentumvirus TaxID=1857844 RepID=A0A059T8M6_9CAUD|nr:hypothetical protein LP083-2_188 [Listeria phage LP-083-2]YP_009784621.1 hypothetical protein QLX40_gp109 [Listeria phage LP-124]AHL19395.1 hypothetical protein LP083-2_188 [Listeria phage LP-083-2]AHL19506.1 hypothetical protein LP124_109 [Listeria phage LP-124]QDK05020.2 hypothetical protein FK486_0173 [Listeria phage LP-066]